MDFQTSAKQTNQTVRQLANLKVLSRLLGHELHAQGNTRSLQLSRDEVIEIQTALDLFIEDVSRRMAGTATQPATAPLSVTEPALVSGRN